MIEKQKEQVMGYLYRNELPMTVENLQIAAKYVKGKNRIEKVVDVDQWLEDVREKYKEMPVALRKSKRIRRRPRSPEEERTLILACKKAWDEWISSGELVETEYGYKLNL